MCSREVSLPTSLSESSSVDPADAPRPLASLLSSCLRATPSVRSEGNLDGYQKKKYLSKVVFTYILGYKVDVGHMEAVNLISSPKYSEKQIVRSSLLPLLVSIQKPSF